jgi:oligosaccharyltransferase complex subunit alpha (ribophorin I)
MAMFSVRLFLFTLFCICSVAFAFPVQFENTKVLRVINVNDAIAREEIGIRAKNIDDKPATEYYLTFPSIMHNRIASVSAALRKEKTTLQVSAPESDELT